MNFGSWNKDGGGGELKEMEEEEGELSFVLQKSFKEGGRGGASACIQWQ